MLQTVDGLNSLDFRAIRGAVTLKQHQGDNIIISAGNFRAIRGAVTLKHANHLILPAVFVISAPFVARSH